MCGCVYKVYYHILCYTIPSVFIFIALSLDVCMCVQSILSHTILYQTECIYIDNTLSVTHPPYTTSTSINIINNTSIHTLEYNYRLLLMNTRINDSTRDRTLTYYSTTVLHCIDVIAKIHIKSHPRLYRV